MQLTLICRKPHPQADDIGHVVSIERMLQVKILRVLTFGVYSCKDIGDTRDFYLFCDGIHLNERSAAIALEVIKPFMSLLDTIERGGYMSSYWLSFSRSNLNPIVHFVGGFKEGS